MKETDTAALTDRLDQIFAEDKTFSGSVLIAQAGTVLLKRGYSMADTANNIKNSSTTKFLIGSVTKHFTGMSIMQLYTKGLIEIDDKLSKYLPDFPRGDEIKLIHLISHSSGIMDFANETVNELVAMPVDQISKENIIRMIKDKPLDFDPGTQFRYSNTGYLMLGYIIEKVSGISYKEYLQQNLFNPLDIKNTGVFSIDYPPENMATGYFIDSKPVKYDEEKGDNFNNIATIASYGAGCLYSTVEDLYIWNQTMKTENLLPKKFMDMIFTPYLTEKLMAPYGFGWRIMNDVNLGKVYSHGGGIPGFSASNIWYADRDVTIVVLTNRDQYAARLDAINTVMQAITKPPAVRAI